MSNNQIDKTNHHRCHQEKFNLNGQKNKEKLIFLSLRWCNIRLDTSHHYKMRKKNCHLIQNGDIEKMFSFNNAWYVWMFSQNLIVYFTLFKLIQFVHWNKRYMLVRWLALGPQFHVAIAYAVCYSFHIIFFPYFPRLYARSLFCWQARRPLFGVCPPNANSEKGWQRDQVIGE